MVVDLREPLLANVLEGCRGGDAEANEEDIGLGIGEGSKSVVIFLTSSIEEAQGIWLIANPRSNVTVVSASTQVRADRRP